MRPTVGSLFSGIGGIDLGLQRAGWQIAWQVEIDPFCRRVLAKHWPAVPVFHDVRKVGADCLSPVDMIAGGFPCQDLSIAGSRSGINGQRSGLFWELARIVRSLRPRFVFLENVPGLLHSGGGFGSVLGSLAAGGYCVAWDCIPAGFVGAPHIRDRLWIVASRNVSDAIGDAIRIERQWSGEQYAESGSSEPGNNGAARTLANPNGEGIVPETGTEQEIRGRTSDRDREIWNHWSTEPGVGRMAHGVPGRVDRLRGLGNACVPQIPELIGRRLLELWQTN